MALAPPKRALALALSGATSMVELEPLWKTFSKNDSSGNFVIICIRFVRRSSEKTLFSAPTPLYKNGSNSSELLARSCFYMPVWQGSLQGGARSRSHAKRDLNQSNAYLSTI